MTTLNGLLVILVLLHGAASQAPSAITLSEKDEFLTLSIEEFLEKRNDDRRVFAFEDYIGDMNMLSYSKDIEDKIKQMPHNCSNITTPYGYRWFQTGGNEAARKWEEELFGFYRLNYFRKDMDIKKWFNNAVFIEYLNPMIERIGCAKYECYYKDDNGGFTRYRSYTSLCVVTPSYKETFMELTNAWPGKACRNKRVNIAGLCKEPIVKKQASQ
ncbi:unnamed protein product [Caenorhabditis brenneri]